MEPRTRAMKRWSWVLFGAAGAVAVAGTVLVVIGVVPVSESAWFAGAGPLAMWGFVTRQLSDPAYAFRDRDDEPDD